ncbi:multidrug effflux MFS transporter [Demequina sp.]|uniref:multidrug effflux MFS transporter n=1 Tax=Demequina sp. TaxID=2050685 RepID=UPI003D0FEDFA
MTNTKTEAPIEAVAVEPSRGDAFTSAQRLGYIIILGALSALGPFTIDLYLPAFPAVADDLNASDAAIQITLTATLVGFALGQLIVGPLADAFGRRKPLIIATGIHVVASLAIAFAPTVELVTVGRVFQGIGAAGSGVVAMAVVRDLFSGQRLIRMLSRLALVWGLAPVLAPVIGAQLLRVTDWHGVFFFLAAYGLVMVLVASFLMIETLPAERRGVFSGKAVARRYGHLIRDRAFVGAAILGSMAFTALFSYLSGSSFLLQDTFGLDAQQFALAFGANSLGLVAATQISARLMRRFAPKSVATAGLIIMTSGAVSLLLCGLVDGPLMWVLVSLFFVVSPLGIIMPTVQVTALANHAEEAGTAASLIGALNSLLPGLVTPLIGFLGVSVVSMAGVMIGALLIAHVALWFIVRPNAHSGVVS